MAAFDLQFTEHDRNLITALTTRLTGANPEGQAKLEACLVNIRRRMEVTGSQSLAQYLGIVEDSPEELAHFISAVTIHTTSWFREKPHFERLVQLASSALNDALLGKRKMPFRVLSAGCSTGEEAYSIAVTLEELRSQNPNFDYAVEGWDVDLISVNKAKQAIYSAAGVKEFNVSQKRFLRLGSGPTQGLFTFDKNVRDRCTFLRRSLLSIDSTATPEFDLIFCRNVLIYFNTDKVNQIIENLVARLKPDSHICLGHSEGIDPVRFTLSALGNATYKKVTSIAEASRRPDDAVSRRKPNIIDEGRPDLILIGASTGGTEVLVKLIQNLPQPCPPVMVVQHIALSFARSFAERLALSAGLALARPDPGTHILPNHLYMALGDYHIGVRWRGGVCMLTTSTAPAIHSVRPAVDFLFHSAAKEIGRRAKITAIVLTGMGKDGGSGLAALHNVGAVTYVQDEASSTVFGMPREAIALGAADFVGNPDFIRQRLLTSLKTKSLKSAS